METIQNYIKKYEERTNSIINDKINFYPLRNRLENVLIRFSHKYSIKILPEFTIDGANIVNEELSKLINQSYLTIACPSIADVLLHKHLEISASKSVILGNYPSNYKDLFKDNIIEVNEYMCDEEIINIIDNALLDKNKLNEMSERLYNKIYEEHNLDKAVCDFNNIIDKIEEYKIEEHNIKELNNMTEININNIIFMIEKNIKSVTIINYDNNIKSNEIYKEEINQNDIKIFFLYEYIWHSSFGHWVYECAIFLPFFNIIKKKYKNIKLLVNKDPIRNYKKLFFDLFDINDNDIYYLEDNNYDYYSNTYYNNIPSNNICIISNNNTVNTFINLINNKFIDVFNYFYKEINNKIEFNNIRYEKTIKNLYLERSKIQNYEPNNFSYSLYHDNIYSILHNIDYII